MKNKCTRYILTLVALASITFIGIGCSTTKGLGKDVEDLGEAIQGE